ncbi:angiopoietin-2-like isoform X2 [Drosophila innubila]|uniref:angiopoietin-2-like isoform X2 n=1 Tax=Drosophila innubila TaxID=198719 RepID=UPI00148E63C1|nr:angiopoietin-2-like isoform X2 [Drosophila innubila]
MLRNIICIILVLNLFVTFSKAIYISERNETKLLQSINDQLVELKAKQGRHEILIEELMKSMHILDRQDNFMDGLLKATNIQHLITEQERQAKLINGVVRESDFQQLKADFQYLRAELEKQKKEEADMDINMQELKKELEQRKKSAEDKESDSQSLRVENQNLRAELEKQKKDAANMASDIQQLRAELEKQEKDGIKKEFNNQQLKAELQQQKKCEVDNESLRAEVERKRKLVNGLVNPPNCTEAKSNGINEILLPNFSTQSFKVACDVETRGGGWTVILRRMDGSVNFYRNWTEYKNGFGDLNGEFFLGLEKIHAITEERRQELLVVLEDFEGDNRFSTFDRNNDFWKKENKNYAKSNTGAWWFYGGHYSHLLGKYNDNNYEKGVIWYHFRGNEYSLKTAVMMIRPRK